MENKPPDDSTAKDPVEIEPDLDKIPDEAPRLQKLIESYHGEESDQND